MLMNVAKMVVLLGLMCSWNNKPGNIQNVTEWGVLSSQGGPGRGGSAVEHRPKIQEIATVQFLVRALVQVAGSIPGGGACRRQMINDSHH